MFSGKCENRLQKQSSKFGQIQYLKHRNLLTLLGVLIVFLTFVIKEKKRDDIPDLILSMQGVQSELIQRQVERIGSETAKQKNGDRDKAPDSEGLMWRLRQVSTSLQILSYSVDDVKLLLEKLPESPETKNKMQQ